MNIEKIKIEKLHPFEKNVRKHGEKQIAEYVKSLERYGQVRPIVVDEKMTILIGNGMYEALKKLNKKDAEVFVKKGLSDTEKTKLMLADNKLYEMGTTDMEVLEELVSDLDGDFDVPGYDSDLLELMASSAKDMDKEIRSYGQFEDVNGVEYSEEHERQKDYGQSGSEQRYAPVERDEETGEILNKEEITRTGRYVTCPHCGEKIWL